MYDDRLVIFVACRTQVVVVQNAASAVYIGVYEDDDVLVGGSGEPVMHLVHVERCKIALAIECVEV